MRDLAKLPKWAREHLAEQDREIADLREQLKALRHEGSEIEESLPNVITAASAGELAEKLEKYDPWDAVDEASLKASCAYAAEKVFPSLPKAGDSRDAGRKAMRDANFHRTMWLARNGVHSRPYLNQKYAVK